MKPRISVFEFMGKFWYSLINAAPLTPCHSENTFATPIKVGVEHVSKTPLGAEKVTNLVPFFTSPTPGL